MFTRLAIIVSHPIQYYTPWFDLLAQDEFFELMVFYLNDSGFNQCYDPGFARSIKWDIPMLGAHPSVFVANIAKDPGTHHFFGLNNPELVSSLLNWQPNAILLFGYLSLSHLSVLLDPRLFSIPFIFRGDSHDICRSPSLSSFVGLVIRSLLFRRFSAALSVGTVNSSYLISSGIKPSRIFLGPHCIDNQRFQASEELYHSQATLLRRELSISKEALVILFAGKLQSKKRPLDLLNAFKRLNHPNAVLIFAGSGPLEDDIKMLAASLPNGRVHFLGFQNQAFMPVIYCLADLLVLPSYGNSETWGLVLNEAMSLGVPVIASNHVGGAYDLVIPGKTGWMYPSGDVYQLYQCLAHALSDRNRLKLAGKAARDHISSFDYSRVTCALRQAVRSVARMSFVDVVVPELYAREGGIQVYSRTLVAALLAILPVNYKIRVFIRNDTREHYPVLLDPRIHYYPCGNGPAFISLFRFIYTLIIHSLRCKPSLSISTHLNFSALQVLISFITKAPIWVAVHGIEAWSIHSKPLSWALRRVSRILPVSQFTASHVLRQLTLSCPPVSILPNSYDSKRFHPGPPSSELLNRYGLQADQPVVFCLSRLTRNDRAKHVRSLINAMPKLLSSYPNLVLIIGGTGDDLLPLRQEVADLDLQESVILPGLISDSELPDHYRLARIFALPSEKEGFGIVFLEAAGSGCAVLAGNRDGSSEPLRNGRFGLLVDPRQDLVQPLLSLLGGLGEPIWHQPTALSEAVAADFDLSAFQVRLRDILKNIPAFASL